MTIIRKYPGNTFISGSEKKKMLRNRLGGFSECCRAGSLKGKKIGEFHWSISLHFVQFRSISFLFIPRRGGPRPQGRGGGLSGQNFPHPADLLSMAENSLDSQTLILFQFRLRGVVLFHFSEGYLVGGDRGTPVTLFFPLLSCSPIKAVNSFHR